MSDPMFTVVMPLFDKAAYIDATLASITAQTCADYEVIVVDDGSHDDGPARVETVGSRIRLIRQDNAGPGAARNRGIAKARGTWIAFLDADDLWHPNHLATLARTIAACPEADVVATRYERAMMPLTVPMRAAEGATMTPTARYIDFFEDYPLVWTSAVAVRRAVLRTQWFGNLWPGEDVDLWARLAVRHRFAVHDAVTATYIQDTGGAMNSQHKQNAVAIVDQPIFMTIAAILGNPEVADRHEAVSRFRNALLLDYTRPSLFNGHTALARDYLRMLLRGGGHPPILYRVLAHLPGFAVRTGSRTYGMLKRVMRR